jgi:hypothetical protein
MSWLADLFYRFGWLTPFSEDEVSDATTEEASREHGKALESLKSTLAVGHNEQSMRLRDALASRTASFEELEQMITREEHPPRVNRTLN